MELENRVFRLENEMDSAKQDIANINVILGRSDEILKKNSETNEKLSLAIDKFSSVAVDIQLALKDVSNQSNRSIAEVDALKDNVKCLEDKVTLLDNKGKIDWMLIVKDNFTKLLAGGSILGLILYLLGIIK